LLRYGVDFAIFDKKEGLTDLSKALAVHARTLEIYDQIGLAQKAVEQGQIVRQVDLIHDGKISARLNFGNIGGSLSPFPFVLVFEQNKNEQLLNDYLQAAGKSVQWQSELQSLNQEATGVSAVFKKANGELQSVEGRYLVGCDGASSTTLHQLGMGFEGSTFPRLFYVMDVAMEFEAEPGCFYAAFGSTSFTLLFPMQDGQHWRLVGNLPEYEQKDHASPAPDSQIPFEVVEQKVKELVQRPLNITKVRWFSIYKVHTRHASTFRKGRAFLAGDSAHVHTPAGGQGMNTGIQDGYNLAWKLAFVLKGWAKESILDSYNEERLANAKRLLQTTDQLFDIAAADQWYSQFFRDHIMANLVGFVSHFDAAKEYIFPTLSQIAIQYRDNSLSWHQGDKKFEVKAGDRLPYFRAEGANVYDRLRAPKFHLIAFSDGTQDFSALRGQIETGYGQWVDFQTLPLYPRVVELFGSSEPFLALLRPDNHLAFISPKLSFDEMQSYFHTAIGHA
jgi:2-polyprenyl-6-methoxyphenol hydroxylase-like FAD-dependent oxidoreductase